MRSHGTIVDHPQDGRTDLAQRMQRRLQLVLIGLPIGDDHEESVNQWHQG